MKKVRSILISTIILCLMITTMPVAAFAGMDAESETIATIGDVEYTDFQEALDAVRDGQTVMLTGDISGGGFAVQDKEGMKYTIDLNGYTISSENWWNILIVESGTASIKNGTIVNLCGADPELDEDDKYIISTGLWIDCKAKLSDLKITASGRGSNAMYVGSNGKVTMSGCKLESTGTDYNEERVAAAMAICQKASVKATKCEFYAKEGDRAIEANGKTELNNCKATGGAYAIVAFEGAELQVKKGTYKACIRLEKKSKAEINDGYFKDSEVALIVRGTATIKAGKFYGRDNAVYVDGGKVTVKKGYFSASSGKAWESRKYSSQLNKVFTISKGSAVVQSKWKKGKLSEIKVKVK